MLRGWLLLLGIALAQSAPGPLTLEVRVFDGGSEVTPQSRVAVHRAGERGQPVAQVAGSGDRPVRVAPGLYDAQAIQERDGRVVNIRWAQRLVVMPYPDEHGRHLEVINFAPGYGALQIAWGDGPQDTPGSGATAAVTLFAAGDRASPLAPAGTAPYMLFVVPAGQYDVRVTRGANASWHPNVEVPLDRTRLWIVPSPR